MIDFAGLTNVLSGLFSGPVERTAATIVLVALAVALTLLTRRYGRVVGEWTRPVVADVMTTLFYLVALAGLTMGSAAIWGRTDLVYTATDPNALDARTVPRIIVSGVVIVVTRVVVGFVSRIVTRLEESNSGVEPHEGKVMEYVSRLILYVTAFVVLLGVWNFDLEGLLIGAGFLGIVIGMAARQSLGSVFAGVVLMFSKPFEIGDWILVGDSEGIVTDISIVNTRLRTFDGESVVIPNDRVNSKEVTNRSYRERLRIELEVGVDYEADVEAAREVAREAMSEVDLVLDTPQPRAIGKRFGDSAIVLGLRYWIERPTADRMWRANTGVIQAVSSAYETEGIEIPFPQRSLSGRDGAFEVVADGPVAEGGGARTGGPDPAPSGGSADE